MDRRLALKQLAFITGGIIMIPSCDFSEKSVLEAYKNLQITEDHKKLLTHLVNTIFPGKQLKSAEEIAVHDFVLVMANDCLNKDDQAEFTSGLKQFDKYSKKHFGENFGNLDQKKSEEVILQTLEKEKEEKLKGFDLSAIQSFLATTKRFAIQGYMTSEYFMTEIMPYDMVPGGFKGSKRIDLIEKINTNG